jgi:hypothetical protein
MLQPISMTLHEMPGPSAEYFFSELYEYKEVKLFHRNKAILSEIYGDAFYYFYFLIGPRKHKIRGVSRDIAHLLGENTLNDSAES